MSSGSELSGDAALAKRLASTYFAAMAHGWRDGPWLGYFDEQLVLIPCPTLSVGLLRTYHGHPGLRAWLDAVDRNWSHVAVEDLVGSPIEGGVVMVGRLIAVRRTEGGSPRRVDVPSAWVVKVSRGQIRFLQAFRNPEDALEAYGSATS